MKDAAEHELVLLLAGSSARRERTRDRIAELAAAADFATVRAIMDRHRSRLILGPRAIELGVAPADFEEGLEEAGSWAAHRALLFDGMSTRITTALEREGIAALPIKGTRLSEWAHGSPGLRLSSDIDVLVRPDQLERATRLLAGLGYQEDGTHRSELHLVLRPESDALPPLELHWRLHWYGDRFAERLLGESAIGADGVRSVSREAMLAVLLLCYARDGFAGLRLPIDLAALADGGATDWAAVAAYARADPEIAPSLAAAHHAARLVAGLDGAVLPELATPRVQRATRLANWQLAGDPDQINAVTRLTDLLTAPPGLKRRFVPARFRPFRSASRNALYLARTLIRWVPAGWSVRRGRWAVPVPPSARAGG